MNRDAKQDESGCLSPGTLMALIDEELEAEKRDAALLHLGACTRCRELSEELKAAAGVVEAAARCLDDERVAAWVDHKAGRMRGVLSEAEVGRIREHLVACSRCRSQVAMLAEACRSSEGLWERIRALAGEVVGSWRAHPVPALRWAAVAAVSVVLIGIVYVLAVEPMHPSSRPQAFVRGQGGRGDAAPRPPEEAIVAQRGGEEAPGTSGTGGGPEKRPDKSGPPVAVAQRTPAGEKPTTAGPQAALMPEAPEGGLGPVLDQLEKARRSGKAGPRARAAFRAAGILHRARRYREATTYYREAAEAAERADDVELRVDALVLLGAAFAELGETKQARGELAGAAALAKGAGYERGEQNARVQMELLPEPEASDGE